MRSEEGEKESEKKNSTFFFPFPHQIKTFHPPTHPTTTGDCALRAWGLVTHVDPLRAYLFDGGIFESNTKHLTYWQAANEGVLGKVGEKKKEADKEDKHTALGADNEKPTPWALHRLRKFVGDATGEWREVVGGLEMEGVLRMREKNPRRRPAMTTTTTTRGGGGAASTAATPAAAAAAPFASSENRKKSNTHAGSPFSDH